VGSSEGKEAAAQGGALTAVAPVLIEAATDTLDGARPIAVATAVSSFTSASKRACRWSRAPAVEAFVD
jgi:hypothetical protein